MSVWVWLEVGALGGALAIGRFLADAVISEWAGSEFPWGTFAVNISGSFVLGILVGASLGRTTLLLTGTASVGSYTTFSTWMLETHRLGDDDDRRPLLLYLVLSLAVGLGAAALGRMVGRAL
jgi:CrcB protein